MPPINKQLIVFLKSPVAGKCKTRLIPFLSPQQASEFYQSLIIKCLDNIKSIKHVNVALYVYPNIYHPFIKKLKKIYKFDMHQQQGNNLGERMHHAIHSTLKIYKKCTLIGTDCPDLDTNYINAAFNALDNNDICFGPAEDGGYVLIAAKKIQAQLFENINWGTAQVLQQSLQNNKRQQYKTNLLNPLKDIDTPQDYLHYLSTLNNNTHVRNNHE